MNFYQLYEKLGKQPIKKLKETNIIVMVNNEEMLLTLKYDEKGKPYFTTL